MCQDVQGSGPEDIQVSDSHIGSGEVRHRKEPHCKEWKRGEVADRRRDWVSWQDDGPTRVRE